MGATEVMFGSRRRWRASWVAFSDGLLSTTEVMHSRTCSDRSYTLPFNYLNKGGRDLCLT